MDIINLIVAKLRRQWISVQVSFFYGRWTFRRRVITMAALSAFGLSLLLIYHIIFTVELLPWNPSVDRWCDYEDVPQHMLYPDPAEMTVITMFLNIGTFKKGDGLLEYRTRYKYKKWMRTFGRMVNRVVAYIEDDGDIEYFKEIRSCLPPSHTKVIKVHRNELPSFKHLPAVKNIYSLPSYPKSYPFTYYPEYTCAMHAKYDVIEQSCVMDYFETSFFAWVDIGLFRNLDGTDYPLFKLVPPEKFNPERVGFSQAWPLDPAIPPEVIMKNHLVWVSGSMLLAEREYMLNFTRDYKDAVKHLLNNGLSGADQEVIYTMQTASMRKQHHIKIKPYLCHQGQLGLHGADSRYFCLGYVCKNAWEKRVPQVKGTKN